MLAFISHVSRKDSRKDETEWGNLASKFAEEHPGHARNPRVRIDDAKGDIGNLAFDFDHIVEDEVTEDVERRPLDDGRSVAQSAVDVRRPRLDQIREAEVQIADGYH